MSKLAIFDLNRTVYDPETGALVPQALEVIAELHQRGWRLYLVSHAEGDFRKIPESARVQELFEYIIEVTTNKQQAFRDILELEPTAQMADSYIIGDRVRMEIAQGNSLGFRTIWFRSGRFANEVPRDSTEQPTYTISSLTELLKILT